MRSPKLNKLASIHLNSFPISYSKPRVKVIPDEKFLDKIFAKLPKEKLPNN